VMDVDGRELHAMAARRRSAGMQQRGRIAAAGVRDRDMPAGEPGERALGRGLDGAAARFSPG